MALEVSGISKSFEDRAILTNVSFSLGQGSVACLMGGSGKGKTTLLHLICGLIAPDKGFINAANSNFALVFQEERLCENISAIKNIKIASGCPEEEIRLALEQVALDRSAHDMPVKNLSGGMKRRVAIVRAMLSKGEVLLMDEPFKGLDSDTRNIVADFILRWRKGRTLFTVTHDVREAALLGADIITLEEENHE